MKKIELLVVIWLLLTGHHWDGRHRSDAGWFRKATGEEVNGFRPTLWTRQPRAHRMAYRLLALVGLIASVWAVIYDPAKAETAGVLVFWLLFWFGMYGFWRWCQKQGHYSDKYVLMHRKIHSMAGQPKHKRPREWLVIPPDFGDNPEATVQITLGDELKLTDATEKKFERNVVAVLGKDRADFQWPKGGERPQVLTVHSLQLPPDQVLFADILEDLKAREKGTIVLGKGEGSYPYLLKPAGPNPHFCLSATTGMGKSATASTVGMQAFHDGGLGLICDIKLVSIPWAFQLDCVRYMMSIPDIHNALRWLLHELQRRFKAMAATRDIHGNVDLNAVGPPLWVYLEEANGLLPELADYWAEIRERDDPKRSPAVKAVRWALQQGRQANVHVAAMAQYLTTNAIGGPEARQNFATRILLGPDPKTWNLLAGPQYKIKGKWPETITVPGAAWVLNNGKLERCQVAYTESSEALSYVRQGEITPFPEDFNEYVAPGVPGHVPDDAPGDNVIRMPGRWDTAPVVSAGPRWLTLRQACDAGVIEISYEAARKRRQRARLKAKDLGVESDFPPPKDMDGDEEMYDPTELKVWFGKGVPAEEMSEDEAIDETVSEGTWTDA